MEEDIFKYRRKSYIEIGEVFFWTATINHWQKLLGEDIYKDVIIDSLEYLSNAGKIDVFAFVIMPNPRLTGRAGYSSYLAYKRVKWKRNGTRFFLKIYCT